MKFLRIPLYAGFLFLGMAAQAQCPQANPDVTRRAKVHIDYLADPKLEGREPGTAGERQAAEYISQYFKENGIAGGFGEGNFLQPFEMKLDAKVNKAKVYVKGKLAEGNYYPLPQSKNDSTAEAKTLWVGYGIQAPELGHDDYAKTNPEKAAGRIFVMDISAPDGIHPHSKYVRYHNLENRVKKAVEMGASAVIFVNLEGTANPPRSRFTNHNPVGVPVIFVGDEDLAKSLKKEKKTTLVVEIEETPVTAYNVIGAIDNNAPYTLVFGAHYDHLGWGGHGSLHRDGGPAVHPGADDNASGTAALMELARLYASDTTGHFNYWFVAFSGEERGLLGSNYFTKNPPERFETVTAMFNMDMVGRLREGQLSVSGTGTAKEFTQFFEGLDCSHQKFFVKASTSGIGPSDHTSFYNSDIPVLAFFTGTHEHYHKPSDTPEKINHEGVALVVDLIQNVVAELPHQRKLEFKSTAQANARSAPSFSVTLGVVPDYMFEGRGMRIDGITPDRPAEKAELKKGDVVTKLGDLEITDMTSYMQALGAFKKGDETTVTFERDGKTQTAKIKF